MEGGHPRTIPLKFGCNWPSGFLRRIFLCEFPLGSYVKLSSAVGAILHQHLVLIEQMVSDKKIFIGISHRVLVKLSSAVAGGHLGRRSEMPDRIVEGDHPRIISAKYG